MMPSGILTVKWQKRLKHGMCNCLLYTSRGKDEGCHLCLRVQVRRHSRGGAGADRQQAIRRSLSGEAFFSIEDD